MSSALDGSCGSEAEVLDVGEGNKKVWDMKKPAAKTSLDRDKYVLS